jgi:hypothetical protein
MNLLRVASTRVTLETATKHIKLGFLLKGYIWM